MCRYFIYKLNFPGYYLILALSVLFISQGFSQTKSNLEILYSLNDTLVTQICNELSDDVKQVSLKLNLGETYSVFSNHITNDFINRGKSQTAKDTSGIEIHEINIVMEKAGVVYGEIEKDGWFGDYFTPRTLFIEGNYLNSLSGEGLVNYKFSITDTINVDQIQSLETGSFPFTKGEIPPEPILLSLIEPVIAIGVAAISIILFFSQRSK
jgi:hypothetical protein